MRSMTRRGIVGVFAAAAVATGVVAAAPAQAYQGELCNARSGGAPFFDYPGGPWRYTVPAGGGIREEGEYGIIYTNGIEYRFGHGNGHTNLWFRLPDSTCH